jgi:hypothetical protein
VGKTERSYRCRPALACGRKRPSCTYIYIFIYYGITLSMPTCCLQRSNVTLSCNTSMDSYIRESSLTYTGARGKILRWRGTPREGMNPYPMHDPVGRRFHTQKLRPCPAEFQYDRPRTDAFLPLMNDPGLGLHAERFDYFDMCRISVST